MVKTLAPTNAFSSFRPHFDTLARVGYFETVLRNVSPKYRGLHLLYRAAVWSLVFVYNLQHLIRVIQVRHSTVEMINVLFILLTTLNTLGKQLAFNLRRARIDNIIRILNGRSFSPTKPYHESLMRRNGVIMHNLLRFLITSVFVCGSMWAIFPLVNKTLSKEVKFTAYFPFNTNASPIFEISLAYLSAFVTFQGFGNVTMDCTIVAFFAQAKVQLQILRYNLEHLADFDDEEERGIGGKLARKAVDFRSGRNYEEQFLHDKFIRCVLHDQKIKWFVKEIESIFAEALTFQILVTAWVICMTVYKIVNLDLSLAEILSMAMYLCCMLAQLFIYCHYGTQLQYESELVNQSVYHSNWLSLQPAFHRQLLIMMVNCRPIIPRTASIIPISLKTYIMVLRSSYTLYTFLDKK